MFTKAQIAKLSAEDQELLANLELSKTRQRQKLLEQARGRSDWRSDLMSICSCVLAGCLFFYSLYSLYCGDNEGKRYSLRVVEGIFYGFAFVCLLISISSARIGRRLNA